MEKLKRNFLEILKEKQDISKTKTRGELVNNSKQFATSLTRYFSHWVI